METIAMKKWGVKCVENMEAGTGEGCTFQSKDPGPWSPLGGVIWMVTFTIRVPRFRFAPDGIFERFRVSGVSNKIRSAVLESLMKWSFFHRCWSSVATKFVFRFHDSVFTYMKLRQNCTVS